MWRPNDLESMRKQIDENNAIEPGRAASRAYFWQILVITCDGLVKTSDAGRWHGFRIHK